MLYILFFFLSCNHATLNQACQRTTVSLMQQYSTSKHCTWKAPSPSSIWWPCCFLFMSQHLIFKGLFLKHAAATGSCNKNGWCPSLLFWDGHFNSVICSLGRYHNYHFQIRICFLSPGSCCLKDCLWQSVNKWYVCQDKYLHPSMIQQ